MNRQTDPQDTGALDIAAHSSPGTTAAIVDPDSVGKAVIDALERDDTTRATALLRQLLAADQGILLKRASRAERRALIALLTSP